MFQIQKSGNRHLVDVRSIDALPSAKRIADVLVMSPPELIARKVISYHKRRGQPKSGTDWRDLAMLLLTFPELKIKTGPVNDILLSLSASDEEIEAWRALVAQEIQKPDDEAEFE